MVRRAASRPSHIIRARLRGDSGGGGAEAGRLAGEHKTVDLLLTDMIMPGLNGREVFAG